MGKARIFDVVVIGAGSTGENVADRAVQGGLSAVVIESELVGGECSYWACMPSKALLRPGAALAAARAVPGAGEVPEGLDIERTFATRDSFTSGWDDAGQVEWLDGAGIDLIRGTARIVGPRTVEVRSGIEQAGRETADDSSVQIVEARVAVVICTGSKATMPPIDGLLESRPWTSAEATATNDVPQDLLIIGGGVIACEMATAFADLGSRVHLVVRGGRLLANLDAFVGEAVAASLRAQGVDIRFNTEVSSCSPVGADPADLILDDAASTPGIRTRAALTDGSTIVADQVLVGTGRSPRLPDMSSIDPQRDEKGSLALDEDMRVKGTDWLYVVGDASGRAHTTHQGKYEARIIGDLIAQRAAAETAGETEGPGADLRGDDFGAPQVVFTRPEVAHVGLTVDQANQHGLSVQAYDQDLGAVAGAALHADGYQGQVRFVVDTQRQVLVGVTFVGQDTAKMLHAATIAIVGQVPLKKLWHATPAYPTMSEVWLRFLEGAGW